MDQNNRGLRSDNNILSPWMVKYISDAKLYVLRERGTNKALNVSYSPDGLKFTQDINRKFIYYRKARVNRAQKYFIDLEGDLRPSHKYYISEFVPIQHSDSQLHRAELVWIGKAYRLLYNTLSVLE